jgi:type IV secretion system protein VirB11
MRDPDGSLVVEDQQGRRVVGTMPDRQAELIIATVAAMHQRVANAFNPVVEAELLIGRVNARFTGALAPLAAAPTISIRVPSWTGYSLDDYVAQSMMSRGQARVLRRAVRDKRNILIIGGTGSGKTTIANTLLGEIDPGERLVILEELSELRRQSGRHTVYLRTTAQQDLTALVRTTMRLKPDRIIIGELRGGEALALLKAWVTGHPGSFTTIHAGSAAEALLRLDGLVQEAGVPPQPRLIRETIHLLVVIAPTPSGRRVTEIATMSGYDPAGGYQLTPLAGEEEAELRR